MNKKAIYEKEILEVIIDNKLYVITDIFAFYAGCTRKTFYDYKFHKSESIQLVLSKNKSAQNALKRIKHRINLKSDKSSGYVYLIHAKTTDYYKIGISKNSPYTRISSIQSGCMYELEFIDVKYTDNFRALEVKIHEQYRKYSIRGEWFKFNKLIADEIINNFDECKIYQLQLNLN
ncbi:MAG: GIY-YIG nuclease family protein [Candidatus Marinimicrobia bacterium]|nr:GIY-YIG nuclease family protein [Candidatus Neomarinimicrobiota bacterium]